MRILLILALLCGTMEAAIFQQSFTTNSAGKTPNVLATSTTNLYPLVVLNPDGSGTDRTILYSSSFTFFSTNMTWSGRTNLIADNGTTITYNGVAIGGAGDTTATNIVTLTQTGTNGSQLDFSLVARGGLFKISLTNNCYFSTPANVANTPFTKAYLAVLQPSTGTCLVTWTNGTFAWPEQVQPINDTNANAVVWYEFRSSPFSNNVVDGWMSLKSLR